ncbi:RNA polymerase sigma factor [Saprospiraceae bacterium]|jgi:RNA polymerase sigma factor (sigma-70 family)|nr:RNA polymerase sigma factor [Bacteroidota bacterium]MDB4728205.1 RNA polymerase sigma factor [Saprospiraceae bacterium]
MFKRKKYTDEELVNGCVANDRFFQEKLYRKYFASMMSMCMRYTRDKEVAMIIINNGFLRVYKKIELYSYKGSLEGWIRRLVFHSLSDYFKKESRQIRFLELENRDAPINGEGLQNMYMEDLMKMVDLLPPATKKVFTLYAIEGYTHVEISKNIGISEGTSKWHLATARKKLKQLIAKSNELKDYAG